MFKSIYKLLLVTGIILSQSQTFSMEKKDAASGQPSSKPKTQIHKKDDLDALMDADDKTNAEKKQGFPEKFSAHHLDILLNADITELPGGDGQQIKTVRQFLPDLNVYVSLVFRHKDILDSIRAIVQEDFARFIESGGDTKDSMAQNHYQTALWIVKSGKKISTYSGIEAIFHSLVDSGTTKSETAMMETKAGNPSMSDRASYKIKIGTKVFFYPQVISNHMQWVPANLIATSTYSISTEEKHKPSEIKDKKPEGESKEKDVKKPETSSSSSAARKSGAATKASKPAVKQ